MRRLRTIRWRIAASAAGFTLVALSLLAGYFYYRLLRNLDHQMERFVDEETREVEQNLNKGDEVVLQELREDESIHDRSALWFCLRDEAGKELFRSSQLKPGDLEMTDAILKSLESNARVWSPVKVLGQRARMRTSTFKTRDGRQRYLHVALSEREALESRANFFVQISYAVVPCVLMALFGGFVVARRATAPIDDIAATASRIQSSGLGERIPLRGTDDELDQLAVVLNSTYAALEESFRRVRDFSASASHQLKTPLTVICGEAELLIRERPDDPDVARFATIADEAAHLARIVDQLLFLARADSEKVGLEMGPVSLRAIVEQGLRRIEPYVTVKRLKLESAMEGAPDALGSDSLLGTAVQNLLDNAARYSPDGGRLRVGWEAGDGVVALEIENEGEGIPAAQRGRVMERFSTAGNKPGKGAGLGLAVACEIAALHKGSLQALDPRSGAGVRFRLEVPRA
ncbi:MAG: HAMP domain-containing histidine kinase [Planctomycetes bacterium]|nr:HAMP domain-containing histidine kinase [Planctomycetota bacterium]